MKSERRQIGGRYLARARGAFRRPDVQASELGRPNGPTGRYPTRHRPHGRDSGGTRFAGTNAHQYFSEVFFKDVERAGILPELKELFYELQTVSECNSYLAVGLLCMTAFWGAIDILATISSNIESWLRAKRNINTEVPALATSVKELRDRQSRFERELEQIRRDAVVR